MTTRNSKRSVGLPTVPVATDSDVFAMPSVPKIGFVVGKKTPKTARNAHEEGKKTMGTATVPVETAEKIRIERVVEMEGFPIICRNCEESEVMRSPHAVFCSNKCRMEHFKKTRKARRT
jgi:hypothetical protein